MLKKEERFQMNNLSFHLKKLEIEEHNKPKSSNKEEIIKIKAEISKTQ